MQLNGRDGRIRIGGRPTLDALAAEQGWAANGTELNVGMDCFFVVVLMPCVSLRLGLGPWILQVLINSPFLIGLDPIGLDETGLDWTGGWGARWSAKES